MNIMDLKIGEVGAAGGTRYRVIRDDIERKPIFGMTTVRTTEDQHGKTHKFMRGIEVELVDHQ